MMKTAYEQGLEWGSCPEALEMRKAYANQAAWWQACSRGDWLMWNLECLPPDKLLPILPAIVEVAKLAARRAAAAARRAAAAAGRAAGAAGRAAEVAGATELQQQADDIHRLIPEWPGREE